MEIKIDKRCFKIDKNNAKAMISGFPHKGVHIYQSIYCDVVKKPFPMLLTLNKTKSTFAPSATGISLNPDSFDMPYKFIAFLHAEYFISNKIEMWNALCTNGLFNIWLPESPFKRFNDSKSDQSKFRILLLRVYEIQDEVSKNIIVHKNTRIDHIPDEKRDVIIKRAVIDDESFFEIKLLLEKSVEDYLINNEIHSTPKSKDIKGISKEHNQYPDQVEKNENYVEGSIKSVFVNSYERNSDARNACLNHYGFKCRICDFDFREKYGEWGEGFIHVHHKIPLSQIRGEYQIDPTKDLIPVCPNCHAMLHRSKPAISVKELKNIYHSNS